MSGPNVHNERLPYWGKCEQMDLPGLGRFIYDALSRLSQPKVPMDGSTPISQREFSDLIGLMEDKARAQKQDTTMPEHPVYDGPEAPPFYSYPSHGLEEARARRDDALENLEDAMRYGHSEGRIQQLNRELQAAERDLSLKEAEEEDLEQNFLKRRREYEQAIEPHRRRLSAYNQEVARVKQRQEANEKREKLVERSRRQVNEAFRPRRSPDIHGMSTIDIEILPPGEQSNEHIRDYYREVLRRGELKGFSQDRLDKMIALPRKAWSKGRARLYGYIVIEFHHTERVLLECPVEDNAIYVLDSMDDRLLGMKKQELRGSGEAKWMIHTGAWYQRLKDELGIE